ncbi:hypothetical protein CACET_c32160 [Clostridium aceticum]|uniref:Uncharacterized protein n=1 Tax=Clostridium aceticum TaxID=84022 RepID=A0A0D8I7A7_9CLOT|nr:hypothetical protein [Clostridium aceticum]AKL96660.1 hypothetical protein CACET_c32160 [Clostridium aceticum]KJF25902.1 hypothetical protein TZ02_16080 [Clostridium aceticum]
MDQSTIITLAPKDMTEKGLDNFLEVIKRIISVLEKKQGIKIFTATEINKQMKLHHHILINRKIDLDIEKEFDQSFLIYVETTDQGQKFIDYMLR